MPDPNPTTRRESIIQKCFEKVASLVRTSPPNGPPVPDSIRLRLYGYYKVATSFTASGSERARKHKRPSLFDPVGRAKYNAWRECEDECGGNVYAAMRRYVEVAGSQDANEVGRKCQEVWEGMVRQMEGLRDDGDGGLGSEEEEGAAESPLPTAESDAARERCGQNERARTSDAASGDIRPRTHISSIHSNAATSPNPHPIKSWIESFLPPPLLPRGQLDISYPDLLYAFFQCGMHMMCTLFVGPDGLLPRGLACLLPNFLMAVVDVALGRYHPRRREAYYVEEIERIWLEGMDERADHATTEPTVTGDKSTAEKSAEVVVGLSVRSLLDLYLSARSYPSGAEVVVAPPVSIPGMVDVLRYHELTLVPVDLPYDKLGDREENASDADDGAAPCEGASSKNESESCNAATKQCDLYHTARWGIDLPAVRAAVTERTVAILIVHPFGSVIADAATMKELRDIADEHGLDILEDCAQCYTGLPLGRGRDNVALPGSKGGSFRWGYTGSECADVSFFSFGPIKTATALGGGVAVLRGVPRSNNSGSSDGSGEIFHAGDTARAMRRMQEGLYAPQSNLSYLIRVVKSMAVHFASRSRLLCGLLKALVEGLGGNVDDFVVALTRGFATASPPGADCRNNPSKNVALVDERRRELMQQLRRRPCVAMLALLRRRLLDSKRTMLTAVRRLDRCHAFAKQLQRRNVGELALPKSSDGSCIYGWLFPILLQDPQRASKLLLDAGFDAPRGATQLVPIVGLDCGGDGMGGTNACPRARAVFDHILYLPVMAPSFSAQDRAKLIGALTDAATSTSSDIHGQATGNRSKRRFRRKSQGPSLPLWAATSIGVLEWIYPVLGLYQNAPARLLFRWVSLIGPCIGAAVIFALISLLALSRYMGPIYLESSNTFAKYCDMLFKSPFRHESTELHDEALFSQSETILELDSTKIPATGDNPAEDANGSDDVQKVLLTGATGFLGSLLLRELLLHRHSLCIPGGVVVIVRSKRGKSAPDRVDRLLSQPMFAFLSDDEKQSLVRVVDGDVTAPDCRMEAEQIKSLCRSNISHVFHCAAAVSFSQSLEDAAVSNITSSLQMQLLTNKLRRRDVKFVYISTAFVHGGNTGTVSKPLPEEMFDLHPYDPAELYKSMLGSQSYASAAMNELGFPNTYTFSKCVCEHLLLANKDVNRKSTTIIIRPSIVGPSVQEPFEGWAGEKPSTIVAAACLYLKFPYNMWCFGKNTVPFIPADVVCRCVISKSFGQDGRSYPERGVGALSEDAEDEKKENSPSDTFDGKCTASFIATVAWDSSSSSSSSFSWVSYAFAITHLGAVCGHVNRVIAYAGLLLSTKLFPWLNFRLDTFQRLHFLFVRSPLDTLLDLCELLPFKPRSLRDLKALSPIIDLPMLFFPYANQTFYFKSDLAAPLDFNGERYMFSCAVAAHRFIQRIEDQRNSRSSRQLYQSNLRQYREGVASKGASTSCSIVVAGASHAKPTSDLWWALTQPRGSLTIRFAGWMLAKIFRYTSSEIEIDIASLKGLSRSLSSPLASSSPCIIIAPTHRSFYDFLIVSYICFSLPELGFDTPHIAAASDFARLPIIGWVARSARAFFVKRSGTGTTNRHGLKESLTRISGGKQGSPTFLEVFIEGKRSRNRTFVKPKTGFLRCAAETKGPHVVIPMTINYEGIPDESGLLQEASDGRKQEMSVAKLMNWLYDAFIGQVDIGRVYVSASEPFLLPAVKGNNMHGFASAIQTFHQSRVTVSSFHVRAASLALDVSESVIVEALLEVGCQFWPELDKGRQHPIAQDNLEFLWSAMLHFVHLLVPYLGASHPTWSAWLSPSTLNKRLNAKISGNGAVNTLVSKLIERFELAEKAVDEVLNELRSKGYQLPDEKHIAQYLPTDAQVPVFVMKVAVEARVAAGEVLYGQNETNSGSCGVRPLFTSHASGVLNDQLSPRCHGQEQGSVEAFGAWGYQDSYFVLNVRPNGSKHVTMKGARYSISGKPLPSLANFVEEELNVAINPNACTFPSCPNLQHLPGCDINSEGIAEIVSLLGNDESRVSVRPVDCARHGTGHAQEDVYALRTGFAAQFRLPDAVVWPKNEEEVQALVSLAGKKNWCLIPFGGGTNVSHSTRCPSRSTDPRPMISVDMKLMNRVRWVNKEDGLVHVEAGITGAELIQSMEKLGFTIGHEPDSYEFSTLGGWIATKASGMKQNKYGNIEDIVKEVHVVGAKATISHTHKTDKTSVGRSSTGVDLKSLVLGSEGCFGIIVSAVLKIWPVAEVKSHESVLLPNFGAGLKFVKDLSKMRAMKPASVRLLDNDQFRLGQALRESPTRFQLLRDLASKKVGQLMGSFSERSVVCATITFEGTSHEVRVQKKSVRDLATVHGGILAGSKVGKAGYDLTFAIAYLRDFALNYSILGESFETFAPWSKLTQVIDATKKKIVSEHRNRSLPGEPFMCCRITQLYDDGACIYFYFCMQIRGVSEPSRVFSEIEHSARQAILDNGGSLSHHHGLGKLRSSFVPQIYSQGYIDTVVAVKEAVDPSNTFGARNGVFAL